MSTPTMVSESNNSAESMVRGDQPENRAAQGANSRRPQKPIFTGPSAAAGEGFLSPSRRGVRASERPILGSKASDRRLAGSRRARLSWPDVFPRLRKLRNPALFSL